MERRAGEAARCVGGARSGGLTHHVDEAHEDGSPLEGDAPQAGINPAHAERHEAWVGSGGAGLWEKPPK